MGRRIEKTINGATTRYLYDGLDIIQEKNASGAVTANYIRTLNIDEPLTRITGSTFRHYVKNALGSVIALTDDAGVVKTTYTYDPFGNVTVAGEASDNPFQYTGRENDGTGLYYYRARYYSPDLQRFISEDPIGLAGGDVNFYAYVGNNPVNFVDPLGLLLGGPGAVIRPAPPPPPPLGPSSSCIGGCHPPGQQAKPGDSCLKCDYGAILSYMWNKPASPPNAMACARCILGGFKDQAACAQCGGSLAGNALDCIKQHCHQGKINNCGQCE